MGCVQRFQDALLWANTLRIELFKVRSLGNLVLISVLAAVVTGFLLFIVDPNVNSLFDGIWAAWVTMTHVGFGDVVPVSFMGRLLAAALILFGLVFFSIFTALVSVALIGKSFEEMGGSVKKIEEGAGYISASEERILSELQRLHQRLDELEKQRSADR
jgi:voltage-gated potassium channel